MNIFHDELIIIWNGMLSKLINGKRSSIRSKQSRKTAPNRSSPWESHQQLHITSRNFPTPIFPRKTCMMRIRSSAIDLDKNSTTISWFSIRLLPATSPSKGNRDSTRSSLTQAKIKNSLSIWKHLNLKNMWITNNLVIWIKNLLILIIFVVYFIKLIVN